MRKRDRQAEPSDEQDLGALLDDAHLLARLCAGKGYHATVYSPMAVYPAGADTATLAVQMRATNPHLPGLPATVDLTLVALDGDDEDGQRERAALKVRLMELPPAEEAARAARGLALSLPNGTGLRPRLH